MLEILQITWYVIFCGVLAGYLILDGFDLGVGLLHPFAKGDRERRLFLNAIGPIWDGNEVWLVVVVGALLAGFPHVYATLLSGFYIPVMAFIFGLIVRAVAIEFRSKRESAAWRSLWDWVFALGSLIIAFGFGFIMGNLIRGIPLDANHDFAGTFGQFFTPYTILMALFSLSLFAMHGSIYLVMKTEGELHNKLRHWANRATLIFVIFYVVSTAATLIYHRHMIERFQHYPWLFVIPVVLILTIANIPRALKRGKDFFAFLSSAATIALLIALYAIGTFPNLIIASGMGDSLTIYNSYASEKTLKVLLTIVAIGVPLAVLYFIHVYYVFRGKVQLDEHSY